MLLARSALLGLVALAGACGPTDATPPTVAPFTGTLFYHRYPLAGVADHETPLYSSSGKDEVMVPIDLTACRESPMDARFLMMGNFDLTRDGGAMYLGCGTRAYSVSMPEGGDAKLVIDAGSPGLVDLAVSPDGKWIAFQRPAFLRETWIAASDGSSTRLVIPGQGEAGVTPRAPIWVGNDRLLVPFSRATLEPTGHSWVYEVRVPDWTVTRVAGLEDLEATGTVHFGRSFADGIFITWCPWSEPKTCYLRRFDEYGSGGEVMARLPRNVGGSPVISPDATYLAIQGIELPGDFGSDILIVRIQDGETVHRIANDGNLGGEVPVTWTSPEL